MPRDIRSYFAPVATSQKNSKPVAPKSQKRRIISSSSDEDEEKPQSTKRSTVVKRKKSSILSDSEDEERIVRDDKKDSSNPTANKKSKSKESRKAVPFTELFDKKPIMRVEETKMNRKLQKVESKFHDDEDFDAVLKQLDVVQDTLIQDKQKGKNNIKNVDSPKKSEAAVKTEVASNKNRKHNNGLKDCNNKTNNTSELKSEEVKSSNKNNVYSKVTNSSSKQNLQKEKKGSSNEDLDISKKDKDIEKSSRKRAKIMEENLFEERNEMKKQRTIMYEKYLQRGGARNPGSKEIPTGAENCLAGVSFLITGVLDSLERNEAEDLIQKYGGRTVKSVSNKVNYIIVGDEAGPAKLAKASNLGIKQISEDDLLEMIRTRSEGKAADIKPTKAKSNVKKIFKKFESDESPNKTKALLDSLKKIKILSSLPEKTSVNTKTSSASKQILDVSNDTQKANIVTSIGSEPLVERYRPKTMKQIIGQQGDKSCAHNLYIWLRDWHQNRQNSKFKDSTSKQTHGQNFKAALLSGPPGVGKTTTVQVVCKELGYDLVEFNASDTRNKTLLKEAVSGLLSNTTMKDYVTGIKQKITSKHVLLMDEVDGMAGNEDRGGLQELVNLIKYTDVPIICICNDRFNTKVKTISTHSYDLKYPRLRVEQIRSSMKSLCFKENIKISTEDLDRLIESTNYDIRQVINHLEFLGTQMTHVKTTDKKHSNKNFKLGPFDVTKIAFNADEQKKMSLNDKIGLYFHDYNIAPLFIQENYQGVRLSQISLRQRLERIANAADSISQGDLVEKVMRSNMMWSLLPLHACFSFVIPASEMSGSSDGLIRFPSWFGRNSKTTRFNRLLQELTTHTRLATGANKDALNMDYLPYIRNAIVKPLIDNGLDGIEEAINIMGKYHLTREDLDSAIEISLWPGMSDSTSNLDSKVKAAFTRAYQKNPPMLPYAINSTTTTKKRSRQDNDIIGEEEDGEEEETDDIDFDKMIKAKKPTVASTSKAASSTRKRGESAKKCGKVRGKGK
ncbi:PREDICTED: replication factor C subunit 1 isoform X1 [Trachymyrmex septentrionalis]|uniref:replication factor C subunit 1 isoform X1 n=1 Tax=Trachymyrmex septentrionalis TaxID=34720 RepID=UPI00084EF6FF|nr:PREDICTED: replication factor C subunit 1 isoform X1 [Trachymyrmex septentrionalis]